MKQRELKFRVWDGERMHNVSGQGLHLIFWNDPTRIDWGLYNASDARISDSQYGIAAVMQFTGLQDKNGKDIYEGDVIVAESYPFFNDGVAGYVGVVEWEYAAWYYTLECVNPNLVGSAIGDQLGANGNDATRFRVIGNIYENPELLK